MKFSIAKEPLLLGLQRVQNVVERRTAMPILSNALIKTENNKISITATDLEVGIQSLLDAEIMEEGAITIKARTLLDIVKEFPENSFIHCQKSENFRLEMSTKKSVYKILGLSAEDFPEVHGFSSLKENSFIRMNGEIVTEMIDKTLYAASNDESRYYLNGVFFEAIEWESKRKLRAVATDAHRLSLVDTHNALFDEQGWKIFKEGVLIPRKGLYELRRLLSESKEDFFMCLKGKTLLVKRDNILISVRLIESRYADYRRFIPKDADQSIELNRLDLIACLKRVSLISTDKSKTVIFTVSDSVLEITGQSPELGDAKEEIAIEYKGERQQVAFNSRYLLDALMTATTESVILELRGDNGPAVIRGDGSSSSHISVVMPIRL